MYNSSTTASLSSFKMYMMCYITAFCSVCDQIPNSCSRKGVIREIVKKLTICVKYQHFENTTKFVVSSDTFSADTEANFTFFFSVTFAIDTLPMMEIKIYC